MDQNQFENSRQTGKKVWESLLSQLAEGSGFLQAMLQSMRLFIRKQFIWFLLFGIIAALVAGGTWYVKPKVYDAQMTVSYVHYEKKIYADMLHKLDNLLNAKSYLALSGLLKMPEESVEQIKSVAGYNIRNEVLIDDLSTDKIPFYITVKVKDLEILPALEIALVEYLNGTEFIQDRLRYMRKKSEKKLEFLKVRLAIVDSLSSRLIISETGMNDEKTITRMELLEETLTLHDKIQEIEGALTFNLNIEVLDGFVATDKPSGKSLVDWLLYGFVVGLGVRFLVLIFK